MEIRIDEIKNKKYMIIMRMPLSYGDFENRTACL